MVTTRHPQSAVLAGDLDGLGKVYSESGELIVKSGEEVLKIAEGWDMNVRSPWRKFLPHIVFAGFGGKASSMLYVTTERVVLVREIDIWREVKEDLSPLGLPEAVAKQVHLKRLRSVGGRQFCEIRPRECRVVSMKRIDRQWSWLGLRVVGTDATRYAITISKTDGLDPDTLTILQLRFTS